MEAAATSPWFLSETVDRDSLPRDQATTNFWEQAMPASYFLQIFGMIPLSVALPLGIFVGRTRFDRNARREVPI
jgi:hypothetical protein